MPTTLRRRVLAVLATLRGKSLVSRVASAKLPTEDGAFDIHVYESLADGATHVALVKGELGSGENVLARVHSSCLTGDVFHSARCDCGPQLKAAMERVDAEGRGVILYLNQEGRGIGLANKIRAYALQEVGYDTVEANERLGFPADKREYTTSVLILRDLGVKSIRLMSNNPRKLVGLEGYGLSVVDRVRIEAPTTEENAGYLATKVQKLGHLRAL
jgi:3,4-dihydroxy 2-butanone 4-phosphate synthase/GTP cyclohydrolase II